MLHDQAGVLGRRRLAGTHHVDSQPRAAGVGAHDTDGSGVDRLEQGDGAALRDARRQQAGLRGGAGPVVEAGVRDVHAGELADHRLELERRLQGPLADLGLVRRVGGDELGAAGEVRRDGGDGVPVGAGAQEVRPRGIDVRGGALGEQGDQFRLGEGGGQVDGRIQQVRGQVSEQRADVGDAYPLQHPGAVGLGGRDVGMRRTAGQRGHRRQFASISARYPAASSRPSNSASSATRTRISHPSP